jgi:hypothetical protein
MQKAVDSVRDQRGVKGVDGIFVNESDEITTVFQATISQMRDATIGDKFQSKEIAGGIFGLMPSLRMWNSPGEMACECWICWRICLTRMHD